MSERDTHRSSPQAKAVQRTDAPRADAADAEAVDEASGQGGSAPDTAEEAAFFEGANEAQNEELSEFDPFRFQANTVPPGLRAELIAAQPEPLPSERWEETAPPNQVTIDDVPSIDTSAIEYEERNAPTLIIRRPRKVSRAWFIGFAGAAVFGLGVLTIRLMSELEPSAPVANVAEAGASRAVAPPARSTARLPASRGTAVERAKPAVPTALTRSADPTPSLEARARTAERPRSPERPSPPAVRQGGANTRQREPSAPPARPRPAPAPAPAADEGAGVFAKPFKPPSD